MVNTVLIATECHVIYIILLLCKMKVDFFIKKIISLLIYSIIFNPLGFGSLQTLAKTKVNTNDKISGSINDNKLDSVFGYHIDTNLLLVYHGV